MREILFRGKKENFGWVYGSLVQGTDFVGIIQERNEDLRGGYRSCNTQGKQEFATV